MRKSAAHMYCPLSPIGYQCKFRGFQTQPCWDQAGQMYQVWRLRLPVCQYWCEKYHRHELFAGCLYPWSRNFLLKSMSGILRKKGRALLAGILITPLVSGEFISYAPFDVCTGPKMLILGAGSPRFH